MDTISPIVRQPRKQRSSPAHLSVSVAWLPLAPRAAIGEHPSKTNGGVGGKHRN